MSTIRQQIDSLLQQPYPLPNQESQTLAVHRGLMQGGMAEEKQRGFSGYFSASAPERSTRFDVLLFSLTNAIERLEAIGRKSRVDAFFANEAIERLQVLARELYEKGEPPDISDVTMGWQFVTPTEKELALSAEIQGTDWAAFETHRNALRHAASKTLIEIGRIMGHDITAEEPRTVTHPRGRGKSRQSRKNER